MSNPTADSRLAQAGRQSVLMPEGHRGAPETAARLQPSCKHDWVGDDRCAYCVLEDHEAVLSECESLLHELLDEDGVDIGFDDRLTAYWEKSKAAYAWRSRDLKLVPELPSKATAHPGPSIEEAFARSPRRVPDETSEKAPVPRTQCPDCRTWVPDGLSHTCMNGQCRRPLNG